MQIEFTAEPEEDRHQQAIVWEAIIDGQRIRCRFTLDAIRSVMPLAEDESDLRARVASHRDIFAALVAGKLREIEGDLPTELIITEADIPAGT